MSVRILNWLILGSVGVRFGSIECRLVFFPDWPSCGLRGRTLPFGYAQGKKCTRPYRPEPVRHEGKKRRVSSGPFDESKELNGGFWLWQVKSKEEAIEWLKRAPFDGGTEVEVRQVFKAADFGAELTPEIKERDERMRQQIKKQTAS